MALRARPTSAKPAAGTRSGGPGISRGEPRPEFAPSESDDNGEDDGFIQDDNENEEEGEDDFEHVSGIESRQSLHGDAFRAQLERVMAQPAVVAVPRFRPSSAPSVRVRPASAVASTRNILQESNDPSRTQTQSSASVSQTYLRQAAQKKKARDREFAIELRREESEYRKKIAQKIEQANKMIANAGGTKCFAAAPTREGAHMVRVSDPPRGDRVISVEIFLREFEKLASVPLGQAPPSSFASTSAAATGSGNNRAQTNLLVSAKRASAMSSRPQRGRQWQGEGDDYTLGIGASAADNGAARVPKSAKSKPTDRSLVQEELKGVLTDTIALTKVLQEQLHELKLKGWNVSSRAT